MPDTLTPDAPVTFPRVIDATMRSAWLDCPHKFFRRHVLGLVKPHERRSVHLHFGSCMARALEVARRSYDASGDAADAERDACEAALQAWGDFEAPDRPSGTERKKTLPALLLAISDYFREWPLDDDPVRIYHYADGRPCIEFSGAAPVPGSVHPDTGEPIIYAGRFDMIGEFNHGVWGLDDKTASIDPNADSWRQQWKLRGQFSGYAWLAREYALPLRGFIVRGIGIMADSTRCGFALVPRPDWMVDAWLLQLCHDVAAMTAQYRVWRDDNARHPHGFPQAFDSACASWGGCHYLDLCTAERPDTWLSQYEVQHWNPLNRPVD